MKILLLICPIFLFGCISKLEAPYQCGVADSLLSSSLLPHASGLVGSWDLQLVVNRQGRPQTSFAALEASTERLVLVGLSPLGTRAFSVTQTQGELDLQTVPGFEPAVPPLCLLELLQLSFYPEASIRSNLRHGIAFSQRIQTRSASRMFRNQAGDSITITSQPGHIPATARISSLATSDTITFILKRRSLP